MEINKNITSVNTESLQSSDIISSKNQIFELIKNNKWNEIINIIKNDKFMNVNIKDDNNIYMLYYMVLYNQIDIVRELFKRHVKLDITDDDGKNILYICSKYNFIDMMNIILIESNITISMPLTLMYDNNGDTILHYIVNLQNIELLNILLKYHRNINILNKEGNTALYYSIKKNNKHISKILIENGSDIHMRTNYGESYLHIAVNIDNIDICMLLLNKNIDINVVDTKYELSALHYSIFRNNIKILKLLLNYGADINIQDIQGSTPLHYSAVENNDNALKILIKNKFINYDLLNFENKTLLHILFENYTKNNITSVSVNTTDSVLSLQSTDDILVNIIKRSKLHIPDNNNNTCLHYLIKYKIWKNYIELLKGKKINIFIKNNENKRPIDYLTNDVDIELLLNIATISYLNILKNDRYTKVIWNTNIDNKCKYEKVVLAENDCYKSIYIKIINIYKQNKNIPSYPIPKEASLITYGSDEITSSDKVGKSCFFTGTNLDILSGLLFLLKKHKNSCSIVENYMISTKISRPLIYNPENNKYNILKNDTLFEIKWDGTELEYYTNLKKIFNTCINNTNIRFIIIPLGIKLAKSKDMHSNYIIYDKILNEIERFEPNGSGIPVGFDYNYNLLDEELKKLFINIKNPERGELMGVNSIKYIRPAKYIPKIGFQFIEILEKQDKYISDPIGFCGIWSIFYTNMRLSYPDIKRENLIKYIINEIKMKNISFRNFIRYESINIVTQRDDILKKVNLTINDYLYKNIDLDIINNEFINAFNDTKVK